VEDAGCGVKVISGDIDGFKVAMHHMTVSLDALKQKSIKARELFEKEYTTEKAYEMIIKNFHKSDYPEILKH